MTSRQRTHAPRTAASDQRTLTASSSCFLTSLHSGSSKAFSKDPNGIVTLAGRLIQSGSFPRSPEMFLLLAPTTPSWRQHFHGQGGQMLHHMHLHTALRFKGSRTLNSSIPTAYLPTHLGTLIFKLPFGALLDSWLSSERLQGHQQDVTEGISDMPIKISSSKYGTGTNGHWALHGRRKRARKRWLRGFVIHVR